MSLYTSNVVSYSKVYGSLAFIPIMLLWVFIAWVIVLVGATLCATIQRYLDESVASNENG